VSASATRELGPFDILRLEDDRVVFLDQRKLPAEEVELMCHSAVEVAEAIRTMVVRGAPAIGIAAAYGYALAAAHGEDLAEASATLLAARPTAVNLSWAISEMRAATGDLAERARAIHADEVERCRRMGEHAVELLEPGARPLTHCNAGGLATGGYGTALGALRSGFAHGLVEHVFVDETRPLLQGTRLTAYELEKIGIPHTVIADSAAGSLIARGEVTHVFTGADRIAANGDTANKIGTYPLSVLADRHEIPFIVVAPTSTVDLATPSGDRIPIEERAPAEVTDRFAARNPAFDVTPAELISAIVTEQGVHRPPYEESLRLAVAQAASGSPSSGGDVGGGHARPDAGEAAAP
jgi:methylthioribose-1-phosphate isomerase